MSEMSEDLSGHYQVQKSRITSHPEYANPVVITQHGWAKKGQKTHWYATTITKIPTGENMKHKTMATYNSDDRKADLMVIVVCLTIFAAIAVMAYFGWLPGGV
jgi:hypothetical protein